MPDRLSRGPEVQSLSTIQWPHALSSAALAGILSALMTNLWFGFFGVGIAVAGALAVRIYLRRSGSRELAPGTGARVGALSGVFGFGFFCVLVALRTFRFQSVPELKSELLKALQEAAARSQDPQTLAYAEKFQTPEGLWLLLALSLVLALATFVGLSALGGAVAASATRKRPRI